MNGLDSNSRHSGRACGRGSTLVQPTTFTSTALDGKVVGLRLLLARREGLSRISNDNSNELVTSAHAREDTVLRRKD